MPDMGKLRLRLIWDGNTVLGVEVKSSRPQAYKLLTGRLPENAVQMVSLMYSVCSKAQQAAAIAATSAAQCIALPQDNDLERQVACEAMQEHLWRLLLDWTLLLGVPQQQKQFVNWHGALKEFAAGRGNAGKLLTEFHQVLLGMSQSEWKQINSYAKLSEWKKAGNGLLAPVVSALDIKESKLDFVKQSIACELMPNWSAADVLQQYAGKLNHEFAALPHYAGKPVETGSLAYCQHYPLVQDLFSKRPAGLLARLIARLIDLLDSAEALVHDNFSGRIQNVSAPNESGLSQVRTARGMLLHYVRIESERVADYLIVAPTEWNFHPQGALVSGLTGLKENDVERLMDTVKNYVLSLDPCVEYEIEITHA
jgi:Ni,Fe-hydrogenase I large subunit